MIKKAETSGSFMKNNNKDSNNFQVYRYKKYFQIKNCELSLHKIKSNIESSLETSKVK